MTINLRESAISEDLEFQCKQAVLDALAQGGRNWRGRSLVSLRDIDRDQFETVLEVAAAMKALKKASGYVAFHRPRNMGLLFEKPSLRTRVSFEAGMAELGGYGIYLAPSDVGLGKREPVEDVASGLSRLVDIIAARVFEHETVVQLAQHATVPVINALSDSEHPIQAFADLLTLSEHKGRLGGTLKLTYVGDGNNVLHALLLACSKLGVHLSAACPDGYLPSATYVEEANSIAESIGNAGSIEITTDPVQAVQGADAVYTDVWASMGQEAEQAERAKIFAGFQINAELMAHAKPDAVVLHCLPAHRGEEVSAEIMSRHKGVIFDQAENRLHTQKALVALMLGL